MNRYWNKIITEPVRAKSRRTALRHPFDHHDSYLHDDMPLCEQCKKVGHCNAFWSATLCRECKEKEKCTTTPTTVAAGFAATTSTSLATAQPPQPSRIGTRMKRKDVPIGASWRYEYSDCPHMYIKRDDSGAWISRHGFDKLDADHDVILLAEPVVEVGDLVECLPDEEFLNEMARCNRQKQIGAQGVVNSRLKHGTSSQFHGAGITGLSYMWPVRSLRIIEKDSK